MKKISIIITLAAIAFTHSSCKKDLNALPGQAKVDGNVIVDQRSAEVALNGAYYRFAEAGDDRGIPSTQTAYNHEIMPTWAAGYLDYPYGGGALTNNALTSESYEAVNIWQSGYTLINAANSVIKGVEALTGSSIEATRKQQIIAEAHFLRAYANYRILSFYGQYYDIASAYGIIIRTEPVITSNIAANRSTVQETYTAIMADLEDAIAHAPETSEAYYANVWSAKVLKMRILLNRGNSDDYTQAITVAKDIINNSPYQLEGNLQDIFQTKGLESSEVILGNTPLPNQINKSDTYFYYGPGYIPTDPLKELLAGDPRESWMLGDVDGDLGITKYKGSKIEFGYIFRLAEVYLSLAEAIIRSGGSLDEAKGYIKTVQQHAGVTDFTAIESANTANALLLELYKETVKNFLCEDGQDWFALLRLPLETVQTIRPTLQSRNQYIMPIPRTEFTKNKALQEQNPGYSK